MSSNLDVQCECCNAGWSIASSGNKRSIEQALRGKGWMKSKGAWYCPEHRPFRADDKAPLFAEAWRLYAQMQTSLPVPTLLPRFNFDPMSGYEADFRICGEPVLVEVDGGQYLRNGGRHNTDKDREKLNRAAVLGFRVLRFSTQQMENDPMGCVCVTLQALGLVNGETTP